MITTPRRTLRGENGGNKHSIKALNCNDDNDGETIKNSKVRGWPQYLHGFKIRKKAKKVNSYQGFVARLSKQSPLIGSLGGEKSRERPISGTRQPNLYNIGKTLNTTTS